MTNAMVTVPLIELAIALRPAPGQTVCGDVAVGVPFADGFLVGVIDGLGHGPEAAVAAAAAAQVLRENPSAPVIELIDRCHRRLKVTRGAVMSLASFDSRHKTMTWIGVGNVEGTLLRGRYATLRRRRESLLVRGGVVGANIPRLVPVTLS